MPAPSLRKTNSTGTRVLRIDRLAAHDIGVNINPLMHHDRLSCVDYDAQCSTLPWLRRHIAAASGVSGRCRAQDAVGARIALLDRQGRRPVLLSEGAKPPAGLLREACH